MKKILSHLLVSTVLITIILSVSGFINTSLIYAQDGSRTDRDTRNAAALGVQAAGGSQEDVAKAQEDPLKNIPSDSSALGWVAKGILSAVGWLSIGLFKLITLFTWIAGNILNLIVKYSVLDMRNNIAGDSNMGAKILETWGIIRDLSNLAFIFVLLFAAIKTILGTGSNQKRLIVGVIVAAVLMNFSLFFTKFVIDVANIIAIFFYSLVAPGALKDPINSGIANTLMSVLNPQSIMDANQIGTLDGGKILTVGLAGSLLVALAAAILFMVAMMFVVRFVVLILVLILSPFAFMANAAPGLEKYWNQWKDALLGQAFFAPLYFLLTWITIKVSQGLLLDNKGSLAGALLGVVDDSNPTATKIVAAPGAVSLIVNYLIVAAFLFATLALSKKFADRSGSFVGGATKWLTNNASKIAVGAPGLIGRNTLGFAARQASNTDYYKNLEVKSPNSWIARRQLDVIDAGKKASFDARATKIGRTALGAANINAGEAQKGGFEAQRKEFREYFGLRGTQTRKLREERSRKAGAELEIRKVVEEEDKLSASDTELKNISDTVAAAGGIATRDQTLRMAELAHTQEDTLKPGLDAQVEVLSKTLSRMGDKEVEAIVESNKKLLESQKFANTLSSRQLETLMKSDKFSEIEKNKLKDARFAEINTAMSSGDPSKAGGKIKALTDAELDMINPEYLKSAAFVAEMRPNQIDTVIKSNRFTSSQKNDLRKARKEPLLGYLASSTGPYNTPKIKEIVRKRLPAKEVAGLMSEKYEDATGNKVSVLTYPEMIASYNVNMLKKMAVEMNADDLLILKDALEKNGSGTDPAILKWLKTDKAREDFV